MNQPLRPTALGRALGAFVVGVAALLVIVLVTWFVTRDDLDDTPPQSEPDSQTSTQPESTGTTGATTVPDPSPLPEEDVLAIGAPDPRAYTARCMTPSAQLIGSQQLAFDGTVSSIEDGVVRLNVGRWYVGSDAPVVEVRAPAEVLQTLLSAVEFKQGERFLVSASDGSVTICGLSAPYSPRLARLYERAFSTIRE